MSVVHTSAPTHICEKHGAVVGYIPFIYTELEGQPTSVGPFCIYCMNEWYAATFKTLAPLPDTGSSRA